tara:strand:+ start:6273 stop:6794 length:522 start_codon:yes stop_codon:yes gene_type:complete
MAVTSGSPVSSANVNSAFVSKTATTSETMVGVLDLNNGSSGAQVTNVQQEINDLKSETNNHIWTTVDTFDIVPTATIDTDKALYRQYLRIQGLAGAVSTDTTMPFGSGSVTEWPDGAEIRLVGQSDSATVTITHSDTQYGVILNGNATLKKYYILDLVYDRNLERFIEVGRNF